MGDFFQDVRCFCRPDDGFWILIVAIDVFSNGHDQLFEILEDAALEPVLGQVAEEAFHHIQPRGRSRREANMESLVCLQPAFDSLMFVGRVVIANQIDFFFTRNGLIDLAQELEPLLMPVLLLA